VRINRVNNGNLARSMAKLSDGGARDAGRGTRRAARVDYKPIDGCRPRTLEA
jgi:hypothetical protein